MYFLLIKCFRNSLTNVPRYYWNFFYLKITTNTEAVKLFILAMKLLKLEFWKFQWTPLHMYFSHYFVYENIFDLTKNIKRELLMLKTPYYPIANYFRRNITGLLIRLYKAFSRFTCTPNIQSRALIYVTRTMN